MASFGYRINATCGEGRNKFRNMQSFKTEYVVDPYLLNRMPKTYRSSLAKFRCGAAPSRLETCRFERLRVEDRVCHQCNEVETEFHVLIVCPFYDDLRKSLFNECREFCHNFNDFSDAEKLNVILAHSDVSSSCLP